MSHPPYKESNLNAENLDESSHNKKQELANILTHALGLALSVIGLVCLLIKSLILPEGSDIDFFQLLSFLIFGLSLIALYLSSALYHSANKPDKKSKYKMWDHCAIYLLIAGTYTPFLLVTMRENVGWLFFFIIWGIAAFGILLKVQFKHRFHLLRVATYLVMGWLVVLTYDDLKASLAPGGLTLLISGGVIYTIGVIFYLYERIPYSHAIWHLFVLGGSICHYFSIYVYVSLV
jgi:hemolysin III